MNYKKLNEIFKNINNITLTNVSSSQSENFYREKDQGEEGEQIDIYDLGFDSMFLKVITTSDSYGGELGVTSIQFVKPIVKQVTDFEPVN